MRKPIDHRRSQFIDFPGIWSYSGRWRVTAGDLARGTPRGKIRGKGDGQADGDDAARTAHDGYPDGQSPCLQVRSPEQRYWVFRDIWDGRERYMSLGPDDALSLAEARKLHTEARALQGDERHPVTPCARFSPS